jgi:hypothetical protein
MTTTTPAAAFAAVVARLAPNADEAQHMVQHGGPAAVTVGKAVLAALKAGKDDSEAGCRAFLAPLAPAADEARDLARHGNGRQQQVSKALLAAQAGATAVDWHVAPPPEQPVSIADVFGDLTLSAATPTAATVKLERAGATDVAASCGWQATGPGAIRLARAAGPVVFAVGAADVAVQLSFAPAPGMATAEEVVVAIVGPFVGTKAGSPASVTRRLLPPVVVNPARSVVSVAQGFDAVVLSANAPTTGQAVLARTGDVTGELEVPVFVSGLQDGDLAAPVAAARFAAGSAQAGVTLQFGPGTVGAPDRAAHLAVDASGGGFDLGEPGGFDFAVREPAIVVTKGTLTFPASIGTVLRAPSAETTVLVQVERQRVSTKNAATIPVVDITLPPAVLKVVGPAEFKAGSKYGYAPMVLHPYGTGLSAKAVKRTPGRAALVPTPDFDLGTQVTQDFLVQDGQDVQPGDNAFHLPDVNLGPLPFLLGFSMGVRATDKAIWIKEIGRPPLCASGGSHNGGRTTTWEGVRGGAKGTIGQGTQLDTKGRTNLGDACGVIEPGSAQLLVAGWRTVPDGVQGSDYADLANGAHDDDAYIFGWNAWLWMHGMGYRGAQLVVRGDKEYNGGGYGVTEQNAALRAKWLARFIDNFNKGYLDAGADARPRHILGLAQHARLGPLESHIPIGPGGRVMIDAIDISMHPAYQLNAPLQGKPFDVQVAGVRAWMRGAYDNRPRYSHDHPDPAYSGLAVAKAHGILVSNFETSPRDDGTLQCFIAAAAWQAMFDFWKEHAAVVGGVGVYNHTALDRSLSIPGWSDGVDMLVKCARGG